MSKSPSIFQPIKYENDDGDDWYSKRMKKWAKENGLNISCD